MPTARAGPGPHCDAAGDGVVTRGLEVRGEGGEAVAIVAVADVGEVVAGVGVSPGVLAARHDEFYSQFVTRNILVWSAVTFQTGQLAVFSIKSETLRTHYSPAVDWWPVTQLRREDYHIVSLSGGCSGGGAQWEVGYYCRTVRHPGLHCRAYWQWSQSTTTRTNICLPTTSQCHTYSTVHTVQHSTLQYSTRKKFLGLMKVD